MSDHLRTQFEFTVTVDSGVPNGGTCRLHGRSCTIPWGWDPAHTDSARPYTLDELEQRDESPHFYAYPDEHEYKVGFYIWRQIRRDRWFNPEEDAVRMAGVEERIREMMKT